MPAKSGDKVKIEYRGTLSDGSVFDESRQGEPLEVTLGEEQLIIGVEKAVIGMEPGERKSIIISPDEGYGPLQDGLTAQVRREQLPQDIDLAVGMIMEIRSTDGEKSMNVTITDISGEDVTIDANHPLAGKSLNFDLKLLEIC